MVELIINGSPIDLKNPSVKYVKQVNDLADVTTVNTSYSYSLTVPKTPNNTKVFKGLGIVGDTSRIPYIKNRTQLIDNGAMIVTNGVSTVRETNDDYKLVVQDGIIDFFRAIENKTIGKDLDLSELSHTKNAANIVASFENPNYRYLISEYNGWTVKDGAINPDYQVPSINQMYIFEKIMAFAGYTYEGLPDISGEWTTFPTPPTIPTDEETLRFDGFTSIDDNITPYADWEDEFTPYWTNIFFHDTDFLTLINNWKLKILQTGNYRAVWNINGTMQYALATGNVIRFFTLPMKMVLYKNGDEISSQISGSGGNITIDFNGGATDVIHFFPQTLTRQEAEDRGYDDEELLDRLESGDFDIFNVNIQSLNADISTMGVEIFDFGDAFKDYSMTDFMKELMFRKSLTPFPDVNDKHIKFMTLSERLDVSNAIEFKRVGKRTNEEYSFGSYAKRNALVMKHDNDDDTFGNGTLNVNNDNLKDSNTLFQSVYYAPSGNLKLISGIGGEFFLEIKFWNREVKDDDGVQTIEYKPLSNRFFLLKEQRINKTIEIGDITVSSFPKATIAGTSMNDVVNDYYNDWWRIFDDLRIHEIELAINQYDIATLRMDVPYYIEKEASYYLLNRLPYESGKTVVGEFLKIKV